MLKIGIVNSSSFGKIFPEHIVRLKALGKVEKLKVPIDIDLDAFAEKLSGYDGIVASVNPNYPGKLLQKLPGLKIIARHGIGYNNIDVAAADELGIVVTRVEGVIERAAVAEHAVALLMSAARHIVPGFKAAKSGRWSHRAKFVGLELQAKTVGIIGLGNIGSRTAEILSRGFSCEVLCFDPAVDPAKAAVHGARSVTLDELLSRSDAISLHCALGKDNYHFMGKREISLLKKGVVLVNTARGELVDETAILEGLSSGTIQSYACDVVEGEPIGSGHRLFSHPGVIVVPHLGGYTFDSLKGMGETMVKNMEEVFTRGTIPGNRINAANTCFRLLAQG